MRRLFFLFAGVLALLPVTLRAIDWPTALATRKAEITVYYIKEDPYIIEQPDGRHRGIEMEILWGLQRYLAQKYGVNVTYRFVKCRNIDETLRRIQAADSDAHLGLAALSITDERRKRMGFTVPYLMDVELLVTTADVPQATSQDFRQVLAGVKALAGPNTTFEENFQKLRERYFPRLVIDTSYASMADVRVAMRTGEQMSTYCPLPIYLQSFSKESNLRRQPLFRTTRQGLAFGLPLGSSWQSPIDRYLSDPETKQEIQKILSHYLGTDIGAFLQELAREDSSSHSELQLLLQENTLQFNAIQESQAIISRQTNWLVALISGVSLLGLLTFLLVRANSQTRRVNKQLEEKSAEVARQNVQIAAQNGQLTDALEELQRTQEQLILSEKMATVGRFVRNVAHELNTPLGAVRASANLLQEMGPLLVRDLPDFLQNLTPEDREQLAQLILEPGRPSGELALSTREERLLRRQLEVQLAGIPEGTEMAALLARMGITDVADKLEWLARAGARHKLEQAIRFQFFQRSTQNILKAIDKTSRLITTLKTFSGDYDSRKPEIVGLTESLEMALAEFQAHFSYGLVLTRTYQPQLKVWALASDLHIIWTNLMMNALQAMQAAGTLVVRTWADDEWAYTEITDSGPGIPADVLQRLFEPFFTTKPSGEGSGLGLYSSRRLAERWSGSVEVKTGAKGTSVQVRLPLVH